MANPKAPILVPLDGSLQAEEALLIAQELARVFGNPLLLVRAGEAPFIAGGAIGAEMIAGQAWEWSLEEADNYLKRKAAELESRGLSVRTRTAVGSAAPFIQDVAVEHKAGLIVMASHGRGWLGRVVLGSVARSVLQEVDTPILLIRRHPLQASEQKEAKVSPTKAQQASLR